MALTFHSALNINLFPTQRQEVRNLKYSTTYIEDVWEQGYEESVWIWETETKSRNKKIK